MNIHNRDNRVCRKPSNMLTLGHIRQAFPVLRLGAIRLLSTTGQLGMPIKVGDKLPNVELYEGTPANKVSTESLFGKGKSIIFGVPGAFTPTCTKDHLPGYLKHYDDLSKKGVKNIACVAVNDPFVMDAWGKSVGADGKIRMLADTHGNFAKALGLELDLSAVLGNMRCQRFALKVEDGKVTAVQAEPDGKGLTCSAAGEVLKIV